MSLDMAFTTLYLKHASLDATAHQLLQLTLVRHQVSYWNIGVGNLKF
jgi:hypothetical protein